MDKQRNCKKPETVDELQIFNCISHWLYMLKTNLKKFPKHKKLIMPSDIIQDINKDICTDEIDVIF